MTDNSSDTPNGIETDAGEPSMEDILASIRRIIAEDDEADQRHLDMGAGNIVESVSLSSVNDDLSIESLLPESKDTASFEPEIARAAPPDEEDILVLDQLVNEAGKAKELTEIETDELVLDIENDDFNPVSSVVSDLEDRLSEDRVIEERIELTERKSGMPPGLIFSNALDDDPSETDLDLDLDLTEDMDLVENHSMTDAVIEEMIGDAQLDVPAVEITPTEPDLEMALDGDDGESDLDIVKSLMADLADTSFLDDEIETTETGAIETSDPVVDDIMDEISLTETETETVAEDPIDDILADLGMDLAEPEGEAELETSAPELEDALDLVATQEAALEEEQDQILNEILELTIEDTEAELASDLDLAVEETVLEKPTIAAEDNPLLQIAAEAEADAGAIGGSDLAGVGAVAAAAAAGTTALAKDEDRVEMTLPQDDGQSTEEILNELDLALAEVSQEDMQEEAPAPSPEPESEPEPVAEILDEKTEADAVDITIEAEEAEDMPRSARKKDAIINEVTEEATVDAFAELSQAVEEKAVYTESGPRVGDIVQDALRPMLKEWLDENLKGIVERAVAKEVKRISSGK